jgi:hypothetical protein
VSRRSQSPSCGRGRSRGEQNGGDGVLAFKLNFISRVSKTDMSIARSGGRWCFSGAAPLRRDGKMRAYLCAGW